MVKEVCWTTPRVYDLLCQRLMRTTASVLQKYIKVESTAYMSKTNSKCKKARTKLIKGKKSKKGALKLTFVKERKQRIEHKVTQHFICKWTNPFCYIVLWQLCFESQVITKCTSNFSSFGCDTVLISVFIAGNQSSTFHPWVLTCWSTRDRSRGLGMAAAQWLSCHKLKGFSLSFCKVNPKLTLSNDMISGFMLN